MLCQKLLGANAGNTVQYIGSVTKTASDERGWDSSEEALNVLSIAQTGDLVVIAFSFASDADSSWSWQGMSFTAISNQTGSENPGAYVGYRFIQSGDANPYVINVSGDAWRALSIVASVFRNVSGYVAAASDSLDTGSGDPNPPSLTATGILGVITGHIEDEFVDDWGAPSGYTLASYAAVSPVFSASSTVVAYKTGSFTSQDPAAFTGSGSDSWRATTIAFN